MNRLVYYLRPVFDNNKYPNYVELGGLKLYHLSSSKKAEQDKTGKSPSSVEYRMRIQLGGAYEKCLSMVDL